MAKQCEHVPSLKDAAHADNHTFQHYSEMNVDRWEMLFIHLLSKSDFYVLC